MKYLGIIFVSFLFLFSCAKKVEDPMDLGHRYYPTPLKKYSIYQLDSVSIDCVFDVRDTFSFEILEIFDTLFEDALGKDAIRIELYTRSLGSSDWGIPRIYHTNTFFTRAERTEENIRYVKLIFPIVDESIWDINDFNFLDSKTSTIRNSHQPYIVNSFSYDSTVTSLMQDEENLLTKDYEVEVYAIDIGLILQQKVHITGISVVGQANDCSQYLPYEPWTAVPIMERLAKGSVVTKKLKTHGFNYH